VDGGQHFSKEGRESDGSRDAYLDSLGLRVLRYSNHEVLNHIDGVVSDISHALSDVRYLQAETPTMERTE
jgi:very-short-patch-repair endonuclease